MDSQAATSYLFIKPKIYLSADFIKGGVEILTLKDTQNKIVNTLALGKRLAYKLSRTEPCLKECRQPTLIK